MKALKTVENGSGLRRPSTSTWQQSRSNPCADSGRRSCTYSLRSLDEKRIQWLPYRLSVSHLILPCLFPCLSFFPSLLFPHNAHVPDVLCLTFFYILMSPTSSALLFFFHSVIFHFAVFSFREWAFKNPILTRADWSDDHRYWAYLCHRLFRETQDLSGST